MSLDRFPVGLETDVSYPKFRVSLTLLSKTQLKFEIKEGPFARTEVIDIRVVPLGNSLFCRQLGRTSLRAQLRPAQPRHFTGTNGETT